MPVLAAASTSRRPGNPASAAAVPSGTPTSAAIAVAVSETRKVNPMIAHVCGSPPTSRRTASAIPDRSTSIATPSAAGRLRLAGVREEQRLAVPIAAEVADALLRCRARDPVCERHPAVLLHAGAGAGRHLDHVVDVEQA